MSVFKSNAKKEFDVKGISSEQMEIAQTIWESVLSGKPPWADEDTRTINFAKFLCSFTAKKACLELRVSIEGSERADYINKCIAKMIEKSFRNNTENACGLGGVILKPSGNYMEDNAIDFILPGSYIITEKTSNGDIRGIIFIDRITKNEKWYTRLEYHHFVEGPENEQYYAIQNKAYMSRGNNSLGNRIRLEDVPEWASVEPEIIMDNVEKALFGYLKMPFNNTIEYGSPEGVSIFSNALEELKDLDVAWTRKSDEVYDSQHMLFVDESSVSRKNERGIVEKIKLPRVVKGLRMGVDAKSTIDQYTPTILAEDRIKDINSILSMIATKAGFSQGQFVIDEKTGSVTATEIMSDDLETVGTITDIRTSIKKAIKDLAYALNKYCDVFFDMPDGYVNVLDENMADEDVFYFKDLLATFEQDRKRAYQLMTQGIYSKVKYLTEYEGFSKEEAEQMLAEVQQEKQRESSGGLFDEE